MRILSSESKNKERLIWMDVLRGILILSVVIGHSTGRFNGYIYQFHMGAFFAVSGYMARQERRSILHTIYYRALTAILPVITAGAILFAIMAVLEATGYYSVFFDSTLPYPGVIMTIKEFLLHGNIYVWWLGAGWFILVLFGAAVFNRILFQICGKQYNVAYLLMLTIVFLLGYRAISWTHQYSFDLILIASFYYGLGTLASRYHFFENLSERSGLCISVLIITGAVAVFINRHYGLTMDWPSRAFNNPVSDCIAVFNGLLFVFCSSVFIKKLPAVREVLTYLGRNTLPIVLFHFVWFKFGFYLLYLLKQAPFTILQSFVPPSDISYTWWWLFVVTGIGGSLILWKIFISFRLLSVLFGQEKERYEKLWSQAVNFISSKKKIAK